jgi:Autoinducer binding domain
MKFAREVFEFIDRLDRLSTISAVMYATERMLGRYGFEHFSFSGVPYNGDSLPGVVIAHRIPAELFKLYVERRYADVGIRLKLQRGVHDAAAIESAISTFGTKENGGIVVLPHAITWANDLRLQQLAMGQQHS